MGDSSCTLTVGPLSLAFGSADIDFTSTVLSNNTADWVDLGSGVIQYIGNTRTFTIYALMTQSSSTGNWNPQVYLRRNSRTQFAYEYRVTSSGPNTNAAMNRYLTTTPAVVRFGDTFIVGVDNLSATSGTSNSYYTQIDIAI